MAQTGNENLTEEERKYLHFARIRRDVLYCSVCNKFFDHKSEFDDHVDQHMQANSKGGKAFLKYAQSNICAQCNKEFEVKSDLVIHHSTVCLDAPYTCKHCRENCGTSLFLCLHLMYHHNYTEADLRRDGCLLYGDPNPLDSYDETNDHPSFIKSIRRKAFKSPSPEAVNDDCGAENAALVRASTSTCKSRKAGNKNENLAIDLLDRVHDRKMCNKFLCLICSEDEYVRSEDSDKDNVTTNVLANDCILKLKGINNKTSVLSGESSDNQREILKPSNVVLGSSVWKNVLPKNRFQDIKTYATKSEKERNTESMSEIAVRQSIDTKAISQQSTATKAISQQSTATKAISQQSTATKAIPQLSSAAKAISLQSVTKSGPSSWMRIKLHRKYKVIQPKQKDQENSKLTKISSSKRIKRKEKMAKKTPKQVSICKLCKRKFKDNYKLKRHSLIHTGERPYICVKCKKTFVRGDHLKRHVKKVCSKTAISEVK